MEKHRWDWMRCQHRKKWFSLLHESLATAININIMHTHYYYYYESIITFYSTWVKDHLVQRMSVCDPRRGRGRPRKFDKMGHVFLCDWMGCDKKFNQSCNLNKHLLTHTGICHDAAIILRSAINAFSFFSGDRPFACDWPQCGMWFTQSSNLNKHYLTHTNERPFKCSWPDCDKRFKQSSNLNKHKLVHTGIHTVFIWFTFHLIHFWFTFHFTHFSFHSVFASGLIPFTFNSVFI